MSAEIERGVKELSCIKAALNSPEKNHWEQALNVQCDSLMQNKCWDLACATS